MGEEDGLKAASGGEGGLTGKVKKKAKGNTKELPEEMRDAAAWLAMTKWSLYRDDITPKTRLFMKGVSAIIRKKQEFTAAQVKWAISLWELAAKAGFKP